MADNPRIEDLRRRIEKDPASIAFAQLAEEYRRAGENEQAIEICRAGLDRHPGYLSARVTLGRALVEIGQLDEAQLELERVLKGAAENLAAIRGLAEIHHARGSLSEALTYYKAALALARNDPDLEEMVTDLSRKITPVKRKEPEDGLSLADMQAEVSRHLETLPDLQASGRPAQQKAVAVPVQTTVLESPATSPLPAKPDNPPADASTNDGRTVAALEQWLDAIHVTRTQSGS